jgi:hypothetical protein
MKKVTYDSGMIFQLWKELNVVWCWWDNSRRNWKLIILKIYTVKNRIVDTPLLTIVGSIEQKQEGTFEIQLSEVMPSTFNFAEVVRRRDPFVRILYPNKFEVYVAGLLADFTVETSVKSNNLERKKARKLCCDSCHMYDWFTRDCIMNKIHKDRDTDWQKKRV